MLSRLYKKNIGISLIVLVITMVVMIILSSAIILNLNGNGTSVVNKANEAVFKSDVQSMLDNYISIYDDLVYDYQGDLSLITDLDFIDKDIIPDKYENIFKVTKDGIVYLGDDEEEKTILESMGVIISNNE